MRPGRRALVLAAVLLLAAGIPISATHQTYFAGESLERDDPAFRRAEEKYGSSISVRALSNALFSSLFSGFDLYRVYNHTILKPLEFHMAHEPALNLTYDIGLAPPMDSIVGTAEVPWTSCGPLRFVVQGQGVFDRWAIVAEGTNLGTVECTKNPWVLVGPPYIGRGTPGGGIVAAHPLVSDAYFRIGPFQGAGTGPFRQFEADFTVCEFICRTGQIEGQWLTSSS